MQIKVLFFGALKDIVGRAEESISVEEGSNIGHLYSRYAQQYPKLSQHSGSLLFSRNREFVRQEEHLHEGDEVAFLPPVSGGATDVIAQEPPTIHRLTRDVIDTRALVTHLQRKCDGAVAIFEGVVRDHSGDKQTLYLEYEAYESMALEKMRQIIEEIRSKFAVDGIGIIHRLGRLEIGDASVVIVITSEHRGPAFDACRYAIDRLKRIVPIWKKEYFVGGAVWVEGERDARGAE
jgi:molybdopterin converting factor subunit 1